MLRSSKIKKLTLVVPGIETQKDYTDLAMELQSKKITYSNILWDVIEQIAYVYTDNVDRDVKEGDDTDATA